MRESRSARVARIAVLVLLGGFVALPLYVMLSSSLKPLADVQGPFTWLPSAITFEAFLQMWTTVPLARYFVNSTIVSLCATGLSVVVAIFAGYAVSRFRFRGRSVFTTTILSTQMFPGVLFLLPLFLIFVNIDRALGIQLQGTLPGLILTYLTFSLPFSIWMLSGYFDGIPRELDEAARVDGCGALGTLFRVILPVARPGVVAVAIYAFMTAWSEVLFASVLTTEANRTLAVGLREYSTQIDVYWNQVMAASLAASVPIVVLFLVLQKHFVSGLAAGAVK